MNQQPSQAARSTAAGAASTQSSVATAANPYVFIVGTPRSGTTLLRRMLDAHPQIAITRETHWIPRYFERNIGVGKDGLVKDDIVERLFEHRRFDHLKLDREMVQALATPGKPQTYAELVSRIFDLYAQHENKPFAGDKTPPYVRKVTVLHDLFPKTRFVNLVRDGRDVCLSMLTWRMRDRAAGRRAGWEEDSVSTTALWWEWLVRVSIEAGDELPAELYHQIRYEDLLDEPLGRLTTMCEFLDIPFDDATLRYHEGKTRQQAGLSANSAWLPPTKGLRDWRSQMATEDQERFEAVAGALLDELGYERAFPKPSAKAMKHAHKMRAGFDGEPLPKRWSA